MTCTAARHGTEYANRVFGCVCPEALAARRAMRPRKVRGRSGPGRPDSFVVEGRSETIRHLTRRGESAAAIAIRLGVSERTVRRHRARCRVESIDA